MTVSLILATVGRDKKLRRFLESLRHQTYSRFHVLVVDQNPDDRAARVLKLYAGALSFSYLRAPLGLSIARNTGLRFAAGDVIGYPDDDCWYTSDFLSKIAAFFRSREDVGGLTVLSRDDRGGTSGPRWHRREGRVSLANVWNRGNSYTMFLRKEVIDTVGYFDERLGLGADTPWQSSEDVDLLIRALKRKTLIYYTPSLYVFHRRPENNSSSAAQKRSQDYGLGMGYVLRKHRYPVWYALAKILEPLAAAVFSVLAGRLSKARVQISRFNGRMHGWLAKTGVR